MASTGTDTTVSSQLRSRLSESSSLLGALDAITRWKPFLLLILTFLACVVSAAVLGAITGALAQHSGALAAIMGFVTVLLVFAISLIGINATGIMLADDVWERPQRGIGDALLASLFTSHRLIIILLLEGLLFLLYMIVLAVLLFICKIPGIGPVLYAVVFPAGAILTGAILFALLYVAIPLAAPAVWNGATVMQAMAMLKEVARKKLLFVVIMTLLMGLLLLVVTGIIWGILLSGAGITLSLSAGILGVSAGGMGDMGSLLGMLSGAGMGGSGHVWALGFGGAVLLLLGATPGMLVGIKGAAIIHRASVADLSLDAVEAELSQGMENIKKRAHEAKERAKAQAAAYQAAHQAAAPVVTEEIVAAPSATPTAPAPSCPACHAPINANDAFCGSCGHRLA